MHANFTSANVPDVLLQKVIINSQIYSDVLNAGAMVGTGLSREAAADKGLSKNHWIWRVLIEGGPGDIWQIQFGMNVNPVTSVESMQAQYAGSSSSEHDFAPDEVFSDIGSINKPPLVDSQGKPVVVSSSGNGGSSDNRGSAKFSDAGSQDIPPSIRSSDGGVIQQPTEGAPIPGVFEIKVRGRITPSDSVITVRTFALAAGTTFGQLLHALTSRGMEPFRFRKIGAAYLGCRDFMCVVLQSSAAYPLILFSLRLYSSQAAAAWISDGLMLTGLCSEMPVQHIFVQLGWRYTRPLVPSHRDDTITEDGVCRTPNLIDRAVWPNNYVHFEDNRLMYNQPAGT
jgi:hypothetical protein